MKARRKHLFVALPICLICLLSCEKDYEYRSANFYPAIGDTITIEERGTPSNGIYWELRNEPGKAIELIDSGWIADQQGIRGGDGRWYWKFVAYDYGSVDLDYWYWRPYEGRESIEAKHQYTITVRQGIK